MQINMHGLTAKVKHDDHAMTWYDHVDSYSPWYDHGKKHDHAMVTMVINITQPAR